eukprot:4651353-Amphidinium_carterae.1
MYTSNQAYHDWDTQQDFKGVLQGSIGLMEFPALQLYQGASRVQRTGSMGASICSQAQQYEEVAEPHNKSSQHLTFMKPGKSCKTFANL